MFFALSLKYIFLYAFAAERLGLTLRLAVGRSRAENPKLRIEKLVEHFANSYNNTVHRAHGFSPREAHFGGAAINEKVSRNLQINQFKILQRAGLPRVPKFAKGQRVFIVKSGDMKRSFEKAGHPTVQKEIFVVKRVLYTDPRPSYVVETVNGAERLKGSIPEHSLRPATTLADDDD